MTYVLDALTGLWPSAVAVFLATALSVGAA